MATVLLGWELGSGLGHIGRLLDVARGLAESGHRPVLALKDLADCAAALDNVPFPLLPAPVAKSTVDARFRAASFLDILAVRPLANARVLGVLLESWQHLLDLTGAQLVIADHSPTLCLAAYGSIPTVIIGGGFTVPALQGDNFPVLDATVAPTAAAADVYAVMSEAQRGRGRPLPPTVGALYSESARFACTLEQLDPYRATRTEPIAGPLRPLPPVTATPAEWDSFAYLDQHFPGIGEVFAALAEGGFGGAAFLRGEHDEVPRSIAKLGFQVFATPQPLGDVIPKARVVIHHGGLSTSTAALAMGRPQILLPRHLEQVLTAQALEQLNVGISLGGHRQKHELIVAMRRMLGDPGFADRARQCAHEIAARVKPHHALGQILSRCEELISAHRTTVDR